MASSKKKATPNKAAAKKKSSSKKAAPSPKDAKPKVGPNPVTSQSRLSDKNRNNPREISAEDAMKAEKAALRASRRAAGVTAKGTRSGTGAKPAAKKTTAPAKKKARKYYGGQYTYVGSDTPDAADDMESFVQASENARLKEEYGLGALSNTTGLNPLRDIEEGRATVDYYDDEESDGYGLNAAELAGSGQLLEDYDTTANIGTLPEDLRDAGLGFDAPEQYENTLSSGMAGIFNQAEVREGTRYRRDRPLGARSIEESAAGVADVQDRRRQNLVDALTRTGASGSIRGSIPASMPVTREEVMASQQWWDVIPEGSSTVKTDEPPVEEGTYYDPSDPAEPFKKGLTTKPNRGYIVPPSQQDTRRRRMRKEALDVAEGAEALGEAMEGAPRMSRRSTTIQRRAKVMATGEMTGEETDVAERTGTTFADIEGDVSETGKKSIAKLAAGASGRPTGEARSGLFAYLRNRAPAADVSEQLKDFSSRIREGAGTAESDAGNYFDQKSGTWKPVEPPLDKDYEFEWSGGYGFDELSTPRRREVLRKELEGLTNRKYTPYSSPKAPPNRGAKGSGAAVKDMQRQSGVAISEAELIPEGTSQGITEPTTTQIKIDESGKRVSPPGGALPILERLQQADVAKGLEPGTTAKLIARDYNIPNLHEHTMESLLEHVSNPASTLVTPGQQRSRQDADYPSTPEAMKARDEARSMTGGPRETVRRLTIPRRMAAAVAASPQFSGQKQAGDLSAELTSDQANEIMGGARVIDKTISKDYAESFLGQGGGEQSNAGTIRPGSEATIGRAIRATPRTTWSTAGEVPVSNGRPAVTDEEMIKMSKTHPTLASALNTATGTGRVVITDVTGKEVGSEETPTIRNEAGKKVKRVKGTEIKGEGGKTEIVKGNRRTFAYGPRVQTPGTVPSVPVKTPEGDIEGSTRIEPMPIHISQQFGFADEEVPGEEVPGEEGADKQKRELPMIAGPGSALTRAPGGTTTGVRRGRVIPADVDVSNPAALATVPAVRRAAAFPRRMAGIELAKARSAELKTVTPSPEQVKEDKRAANRGVREAKLQAARRGRFTAKPESEQRQTRESLYIQEPSVEAGVSSPAVASMIKDYADFTENTYVSSPSKPLNVPSVTGVVNKPGAPKTTEMVSRVHGFETSSGTPSRDVAGLPREDVMRKIGTTSAFRTMKNAENAPGYGGIVTPAISREFGSGNLSMANVYDPTNRGFGNPERKIPGRLNNKGDLNQTPTFDERISSIYGAGKRGSTVLQGGQWVTAQPAASPMSPPSMETGSPAPSTNFGVANPRTTAVGLARNPIGTRPTPKSPESTPKSQSKKSRKPKS